MNKRTKKIILLSITICIAVALISFAASRSSKQIENSFSQADAGISIIENDVLQTTDTASVDFKNDENGSDFTAEKKIQIKNSDGGSSNSIPVFVRVCIFPKYYTVQEDATAAQIALLQSDFPSSVSGTSFTIGDVTFNLAADWSDNWFYYKGYFYYIGESDDNVDGVLNVSETTPPLLASVSVNKEKYNEDYVDMGAQLKVVVLADAIQTVGNTVGSDGGALKRWGVSRLVSNDKKRPKASDDVVSTAAAEAANTTASRAAVTSGDYVVTKYQLARIQNMVASVTVSTVYDVDDIYENEENEEETGEVEEEEEVSEVDSVENEAEEIEEIEED